MIVVRLKGGMGNQMFQYALGRSLSISQNTELKLDINAFGNQPKTETMREYCLNNFNIVENFASKKDVPVFWPWFESKILKKYHIGYEPEILNKKGNIYLDGFWHSEKYFENIREVILKDFTLKKPLSLEANKTRAAIHNSKNSVSLHVRRGDLATDPETEKYHGLVGPEHYQKAISLLKEKIGEINIFIFSDDIEWVKKNMTFRDPSVFVSNHTIPAHEELSLMSLCNHNIIANSSFSWWGAWLNQNPKKIVIAPARWLAKTGNDYYKEIPESWIKI